jgi:hypothetical protein
VDRIVRERRASTLKVYEAKWKVLEEWCRNKKVDALAMSPGTLADFFIYLFDVKKLAPITIKGYRAAISRVYRMCELQDPGQNKDLTMLINNFCLERPRNVHLFPKWSLEVVLDFLAGDTFEPLDTIEMEPLTKKTLFLVTLALAGRISEIHALSARPECLRINQDGSISLLTFPGFVAKNRLHEAGSQQYTLSPLDGGGVYCPVRALQIYLHRTRNKRRTADPLFLPLSRAKTTPQLLSSWIRSLIQDAYKAATAGADNAVLGRLPRDPGRTPSSGGTGSIPMHGISGSASCSNAGEPRTTTEPPVAALTDAAIRRTLRVRPAQAVPPGQAAVPPGQAGSRNQSGNASLQCSPSPVSGHESLDQVPNLHRPAHELRAIATSLAFQRGAALGDITKAVGWSSDSTFGRFYLRHMAQRATNNHVSTVLRLPALPRSHASTN